MASDLVLVRDKQSHVVDGHLATHREKHSLHVGLGSKLEHSRFAVIDQDFVGLAEFGGETFVGHRLEN